MGNDYVFIVKSDDNHYIESLKRLTDSEVMFSRVFFLYFDQNLKDYVESIKDEADALPVGACVARETDDLEGWIKKNLTINSRVVTWAADVRLNPESVIKLGRHLIRPEVAAICASRKPELWVDDIYEPTKTSLVEGKGLKPVDLLSTDFLIIRSSVISELEFGDWFGLSLRKLGYENWLDLDADIDFVKEKNKNAKNNNVKGSACKLQVDVGEGES